MPLFDLKSNYQPKGDQPRAIKQLAEGLNKGYPCQTLLGVTGSGKTFTVASVIKHFKMPVLVIAPNKALAAQLYREYKNFFPHNSVNYFVSYYDYYQPEAYLPITDTYIEKEAMINEEIDRLRHQATNALLTRKDVIIIASVSCIYNLGVPASYLESALHLEEKRSAMRGDLIRQLARMNFARTNGELKRGLFRVRGDVFEIMLASEKNIYRLELANQQIKEIFSIDPVTRRINEQMKELVIFPPKHFVSHAPQIKQALGEIKKELRERLAYFKKRGLYLEAERLERRTRYDMEMIDSLGYCHGVENYSRHLTGKLAGQAPDTLLSYFPCQGNRSRFLTIVDESHIALPQIGGMHEGDRARKEALIQYGWRLPSALDNRPLKFDEFLKRVGPMLFTSATPGKWELGHSQAVVEQIIRPTGLVDPPIEVRPIFRRSQESSCGKKRPISQVDDLIGELEKIIQSSERAIVNTLTKKMAEDLCSFLKNKKLKVNYLHSEIHTLKRTEILTDFRKGKFDVLIGVNLLREGLDLPEVSLVAILDADREGFLRNETSLIQTMGRAARHLRGKVILYADEVTGSMKRAISEAERRREKQMAYNKKHGIKPKGIQKKIEQFIDVNQE